MTHSANLRLLLLTLAGLLLFGDVLTARIGPVAITYPSAGSFPNIRKRAFWISLAPFDMPKPDGNPTVTIDVFVTPVKNGQQLATRLLTTIEQPYSWSYGNGLYPQRLDSTGVELTFREALADLPNGWYIFHATADDGDGPSDSTNSIKVYLIDDAYRRLDPPEILSIESQAEGTVVMRLAPLRHNMLPENDYQSDNPTTIFSPYRADGIKSVRDDSFFVLMNAGGGAFHRLFEERGIGLDDGPVRVTITGLQSGPTSFFMKFAATTGFDTSNASGIVSVQVKGNRATGGPYDVQWEVETASAVAGDELAPECVLLYPNPASEMLRLRLPAGARLRIVDALGNPVSERAPTAAPETTAVDVARLPAGSYTTLVTAEGRTTAHRFTIVR